MTDMIERVARAIYDRQAKLNHSEHSWETISTLSKNTADEFRADARAAVEAVREPDDATLQIFERLIDTQCHEQTLEDGWRSLFDAAIALK